MEKNFIFCLFIVIFLMSGQIVQAQTPTPNSCAIVYTILAQSDTGAAGTIVITNTSAVTINGWVLSWVFPGNQVITTLFSAIISQTGQSVSVTSFPDVAVIPPGESRVIGFILTYTGSNPSPTSFLLNGIPCTAIINTATPTPTPTPTARFDSCAVNYSVVAQSNSAASVLVTVTNTSTVPMNGWSLAFTFPGNQTITQAFNAAFTQTGSLAIISNTSDNPVIPAGGSVTFALLLSFTGANPNPTAFVLNGITCTSTITPTPTVSQTPSPTPTIRAESCAVEYAVVNQWNNGASVRLTVTNTSSVPINGWTLTWAFPGGQTITGLQNGNFTQSGSTVVVTNQNSNPVIPAGGSAVITFTLAFPEGTSNPSPTTFVLNGITCTSSSRNTPIPTNRAESCAVNYTVVNQWNNGASVRLTVTNTSTAPINGWTLTWAFPGGQTITGLQNGNFTQSGSTVVVTNQNSNPIIPAGGSAVITFTLAFPEGSPNLSPTTFILNGITCSRM